MKSCHEGRRSRRSRYYRLATHVDHLGWQNFTEGRIPRQLERVQCRYYHKIESRRSSQKWAAELIDQIFKLTHLQWKYRNSYLKYRANDSAETVEEYESRMRRIEETLQLTDPENLLEEDRFLVEDYSLEELAAASSTKRINWEESINAAQAAAGHARVRSMLEELSCSNYGELQTSFFNPRPRGRGRGGRRSNQSTNLDWDGLEWLRPEAGGGRDRRRTRIQPPPGGEGSRGRRRRPERSDLETATF